MPCTHLQLMVPGLAAFLLAAPAGAQPSAKPLDRTEVAVGQPLKLNLRAGSILNIKGVNAHLELTRAAGSETIVTATLDAAATEPRVEMIQEEGVVTICTVYVSPNPKKPNECRPGGKGRLTEGVKRNSPFAHFRIDIPDGLRFFAQVFEGNLKSEVGASEVNLKTTIGDISIVDNGSPRIDADAGLKGNLTALISADERQAERFVSLKVTAGDLKVTIPTTVPISYTIISDASINTPYPLEKPLGAMRMGKLGPAGATRVFLSLTSSSLMGHITLAPQRR